MKVILIFISLQTMWISRGATLSAVIRRSLIFPLEDKYKAMLEELQKAQEFIFMEYFIIDDGEMWREIVKILLEKAKAGVEVRLLYDGMGSQFTLPFRYKKKLTDQGVKCLVFNPFRPMLSTIQNNRDHRKILVIDGNVAFKIGRAHV